MNRGQIVWVASVLSAFAMAVIAAAAMLGLGWPAAAIGIFLYGMAWLAAASTLQAAASLAAPNWVRARALGIYQMSFFGAMTLGSAVAGWLGEHVGSAGALALFAGCGLISGALVRKRGLDAESESYATTTPARPLAPAPAADALRPLLAGDSGRVLEVVRYHVAPDERPAFLTHMEEVRRVRLRAGAATWRLYEDVARPERYVELWSIESWTEHLREQARMTETDRALVAAAMAFDRSPEGPEAVRYLHVV
jgi:MFS family permease